jgi:hypothetical protein
MQSSGASKETYCLHIFAENVLKVGKFTLNIFLPEENIEICDLGSRV